MTGQDAFEFDKENGIIRDKLTGERCLIVGETRICEMTKKLIDLFSTGAFVVLFEMNKAMSKQLFNHLPAHLKKDPVELMEKLIDRFQEAGYGKIELVEFNLEEETVTIRVITIFTLKFAVTI